MTRFLLVCAGGAIGSGVRYLISLATVALLGAAFPFGTLIVNLSGSFAIGLLMESIAPSSLRLLLVTGVLGGFTTYSSFNEETLQMLRSGSWGTALLNVGLTLVGCLIAGFLGAVAARMLR